MTKKKETPRAEALRLFQLLRRLESADDNGYCSCVTCGKACRFNEGDGGHYIPKGDSSFWALEAENVHFQCKYCNGFGMRYGTAASRYTLYMVDRYGRLFVDNMEETKKDIRKISAQGYRDLIADFKERIKFHKSRIGQ